MEDSCLREADLTNALNLMQAYQFRHWIDLFNLLLTSGSYGTPGECPVFCRPPFLRECVLLGACFWQVGLAPLG